MAHQLIVVVVPPVRVHLAEDGPEKIVQLVVLIIIDTQRWQEILARKIKSLSVVRPIWTILNQMIRNSLQQLLIDCMILANINANQLHYSWQKDDEFFGRLAELDSLSILLQRPQILLGFLDFEPRGFRILVRLKRVWMKFPDHDLDELKQGAEQIPMYREV